MKHIAVVEDERNIRDLMKLYLHKEGYQVSLLQDGQDLEKWVEEHKPDLIILDIMLPGRDGFELCRELRRRADIPIIFVSAREEELDRIVGLELGADDYLTKPFSPREMVVRIKNIFRRLEKPQNREEEEISIQDLCLYPARRVLVKNEKEIHLTTREYELFFFLVCHRNVSFNRDQLIERVWGYDYPGESRIVDDLIKRLRKKLHEAGSSVEITTVWGYGYRLDDAQ
ncbi:MAG TPA: response regulator transcription factor [Syntrophomonadaceae bacterium]|nr:response regulator transcription factor [Syntrophomonadaceae bacterium]